MTHIQDYKIIESGDKRIIEMAVCELLLGGWELHGSLIVTRGGQFIQVMVKLTNKPEPKEEP